MKNKKLIFIIMGLFFLVASRAERWGNKKVTYKDNIVYVENQDNLYMHEGETISNYTLLFRRILKNGALCECIRYHKDGSIQKREILTKGSTIATTEKTCDIGSAYNKDTWGKKYGSKFKCKYADNSKYTLMYTLKKLEWAIFLSMK